MGLKRWLLYGAGMMALFVVAALFWAVLLTVVELRREQVNLRNALGLEVQLLRVDVESETQALRGEMVRESEICRPQKRPGEAGARAH